MIVRFGVLLMLGAATSLRAAAAGIEIGEQLYRGIRLGGPCHATIRNHLLRLGLYEINRAKAMLADWVWIVDHTIQVGNQLCMVVLGIPLSHYQRLGRPLRCQDLQVLELLPMEKSNGPIMGEHFKDLASRYGQPVAVVSDDGSDIRGGFHVLCQAGRPPVRCVDMVHKVSRLIKRILDGDSKWASYRTASCSSGHRLRQSILAHLTPPKPKTKARHMNLDPEIQWGVGMLRLLDGIETNEDYDDQQRAKLRECAGWLRDYRVELTAWSELMAISRVVCDAVRRHGYHTSLVNDVAPLLPQPGHAAGAKLIAEILAFLEVQQSCCDASSGPLPGSSEVIESLFGHGKRLEGQQSRSGFTAQLLAMAACVCDPTEELISDAFAAVSTKAVTAWQKQFLGPSIQARRRRDLGSNKCQKPAQEKTEGNPKIPPD